jgi:hypothetical protein
LGNDATPTSAKHASIICQISSRRITGENVIQISSAVQYPHDLDNVFSQSIKDDVGASSNRSETRSYFVARSPGEWVIFDHLAHITQSANCVVRPMLTGTLSVVIPDFG